MAGKTSRGGGGRGGDHPRKSLIYESEGDSFVPSFLLTHRTERYLLVYFCYSLT